MVRVDAGGDALVGTILRAAVLRDGVAEVRTGGDLLADSDPPREERESRHKAVSLWRALGIAQTTSAADITAAPHGAVGRHCANGSLRLVALADPFERAVTDMLQGTGWTLAGDEAAVTVLTGNDRNACKAWLAARPVEAALVAFGDAAAIVLAQAGFAVEPIAPEQGRLLKCAATEHAPWPRSNPFHVGRYSSLALASDAIPSGWAVWAQDPQGRPTALAHGASRTVCLLWRPDSLLCDAQARMVMRFVLAFAAQHS
jgi:hypothetical protein